MSEPAKRYACTWREFVLGPDDRWHVGDLKRREFDTVEEAERECMRVFPLDSTFAAWLSFPNGVSLPIHY